VEHCYGASRSRTVDEFGQAPVRGFEAVVVHSHNALDKFFSSGAAVADWQFISLREIVHVINVS